MMKLCRDFLVFFSFLLLFLLDFAALYFSFLPLSSLSLSLGGEKLFIHGTEQHGLGLIYLIDIRYIYAWVGMLSFSLSLCVYV